MSENITEQIFYTVHKSGPINENSTQKSEHANTSCKWETYNPTIHLNDYENSEINKDDNQKKVSLKIYNFVKLKRENEQQKKELKY